MSTTNNDNAEWNIPYIHMKTIDPLVNYETTGYFKINNKTMRFFHTGVSNQDPDDGRRRVYFPVNKSWLLWHTHSSRDGFWPSFEDLRYGGLVRAQPVNNRKRINVLFTTYGTWIYKGFNTEISQRQVNCLYNKWKSFHDKMESLTQEKPHWSIDKVDRCIVDFIEFAKNILTYHIEFVPNYNKNNNVTTTVYLQKVYDHILKIA